jgi:DNA adenine methylase
VAPGDFVYFDPPYVPVTETASFTGYTAGGFGGRKQHELAQAFRRLDRLGAHLLLSNSDTPVVRELYRGFKIEAVDARRSINSDASKRGPVGEVLVSNEPTP